MKDPQPFVKDWLWNLIKGVAGIACLVWLFTGRPDRIMESARNARELPRTLNIPISDHTEWIEEAHALARRTGLPFLRALEVLVLDKIAWQSDWRKWGVREFFPSPEQVAATRIEDCDGRAILFVNLARAAGYTDVRLVWGAFHVWAIDGYNKDYLLVAPSYFMQMQEAPSSPLEFGDPTFEEISFTGDAPPTDAIRRPWQSQLRRDIQSMGWPRVAGYSTLAILFFIAPNPSRLRRKND